MVRGRRTAPRRPPFRCPVQQAPRFIRIRNQESGNFSDQALINALLTVGADRILFAADYPYEMMEPAARWIERAPISENDRRKIAYGNARRLFRLGGS